MLLVEEHICVLECGHRKGVGGVFDLLIIQVVPLGIVLTVRSIMATSRGKPVVAYACEQLVLFRFDRDGLVHVDITR